MDGWLVNKSLNRMVSFRFRFEGFRHLLLFQVCFFDWLLFESVHCTGCGWNLPLSVQERRTGWLGGRQILISGQRWTCGWTFLAPSYTFPFIQTADRCLLHSNLHPLMSVCKVVLPRPSTHPPHLAALILTLLPNVLISSSPAEPGLFLRPSRSGLQGEADLFNRLLQDSDSCGSCGRCIWPSPATGDSVPEQESPDGLCLNHFTAGSNRWAPYGIGLHIWMRIWV